MDRPTSFRNYFLSQPASRSPQRICSGLIVSTKHFSEENQTTKSIALGFYRTINHRSVRQKPHRLIAESRFSSF